MDKAELLYNKLKNRDPFCFVKLNDGEIKGLKPGVSISRGDEVSTELMSKKLMECLTYEHKDYYIGIPCKICYKSLHDKANSFIKSIS